MFPLRPENYCDSCSYHWYPRGKNVSSCCPQCGSGRVRVITRSSSSEPSKGCLGVGFIAIVVIVAVICTRFGGHVKDETSASPASEEKGQVNRSNETKQSTAKKDEEEKKTKQGEERQFAEKQDRIDRQEREAILLWKQIAQLDWRRLEMPREDRGGYVREIKDLCKQIIDSYPDCPTADKSREKLKELEERK